MSHINQTIQEREIIKIAIPMRDGAFSEHFGGAKVFRVYEGNRQTGGLVGGEVSAAPEHKPGSLPMWLEQQNVDAVVVSAIGERALILLADAGITVFLADENQDQSALAMSCLTGKLKRVNGENSRCGGHHHDHGDGDACHQH